MPPRPPRLCRPQEHQWVFADTLLSMIYADHSAVALAWSTCPRCQCALELSGAVDGVGRNMRIQGPSARLWHAQGGYTAIPLS